MGSFKLNLYTDELFNIISRFEKKSSTQKNIWLIQKIELRTNFLIILSKPESVNGH